jgi:hypothetical protein
MAQRDNRRTWRVPPCSRPKGRCPVQPSTPLGPGQVNVLLLLQDDRRGPPRERPPDKPPPWKGAVVGYSLEMAGTRNDQRASSPVCGAYGVGGNTSPMQEKHLNVKSPSFSSHRSQAAGTSLKISAQSWKRANGHRSRVNGYVCGWKQN